MCQLTGLDASFQGRNSLLSEQQVIERIFSHIDNKTTDLGDTVWTEPVANYLSEERFDSEIVLLRNSLTQTKLPIMRPNNDNKHQRG